ncbi:MAG: TetR family transcriptional regulator [Colwellia sp.]|nr:TetR family transcriptional regulator [Colwellia sp.]
MIFIIDKRPPVSYIAYKRLVDTYLVCMNWQRARTDEKKNERKEAIYQAAFTLFKKNGYDKVSFNAIAVEAGFTKSNMYRYFSSKDEIFLNVFADLFEQWVGDFSQQLRTLKQEVAAKAFADIWVKSMLSQPNLLDLMPILFTSLERNSSFEQLLEFKRLAMKLLYGLTLDITRIYPDIEGEKAFKLLNLSYAATTNSWTATTQSDALKKLYQLEEFQALKPGFEKDLTTSIEIIIQGLKASNQPNG